MKCGWGMQDPPHLPTVDGKNRRGNKMNNWTPTSIYMYLLTVLITSVRKTKWLETSANTFTSAEYKCSYYIHIHITYTYIHLPIHEHVPL